MSYDVPTPTELCIRLARREDAPLLAQLIEQSARALSAPFYTPAQTEAAIKHIFGVDTQLIDDGTYFVAALDGQPVACGGWSKRRTLFGGDQMKESSDPLLDPTHDAARIRAFFVHPDFARRGIGSRLIDACETAARKAGFSRIELVATLPGEPLYTARGYQAIDRFDVHLPGEIDVSVVRMGKSL